MARRRAADRVDPREESFLAGVRLFRGQAVFEAMNHGRPRSVLVEYAEDAELSRARGFAAVRDDGHIVANRYADLTPDEWLWVLTHCALHLGFGHTASGRTPSPAEQTAACLVVARFQTQLRLGTPPIDIPTPLPAADEHALAERWRFDGVPEGFRVLGTGGESSDIRPLRAYTPPRQAVGIPSLTWPELFAVGLASAATAAVEGAGSAYRPAAAIDLNSPWEQARRWFVSAYPLLGALAAGFRVVGDVELTRAWNISIAAVDAGAGEIYVNPLVTLPEAQCRFVLAHEMLHAALRHGERVGSRDAYLWNVATDFVINGWLVEMGVGELPPDCLYDPALKGWSSEQVYDEITKNLRRYRKLATLRGSGLGDMLDRPLPGAGEATRAADLDDFYRRALTSGLEYHEQNGRGWLPAGLVAEIRVLDAPAPPWDVRLAQWFDHYFTPMERTRSYARPSRRQASTPDIPRPGWHRPEQTERKRTFGVVLDTSGSMPATLMGKALGAIASFALARDVPAARVVFCDAAAYDAGYLPVEEIAGRVRVRGRGGTELQPAIRLLERAADFPDDGPILIITDGQCDVLRVRRSHAYLMPTGARLPFTPRGEVFPLR
ncbi:hypothetical protein AB0M47_28565 [Hamadaea sp. NPDC051192]|uniref:vWA domain-containing protein n=1 Tax=Hamadaea sp. NPDC051192 TaxID=3154940 RepID=UPI00342E90F5